MLPDVELLEEFVVMLEGEVTVGEAPILQPEELHESLVFVGKTLL